MWQWTSTTFSKFLITGVANSCRFKIQVLQRSFVSWAKVADNLEKTWNSNFKFIVLQELLDLTLPQALQWCLLKDNENSTLQPWHMVTRLSWIQTGASWPWGPKFYGLRSTMRPLFSFYLTWVENPSQTFLSPGLGTTCSEFQNLFWPSPKLWSNRLFLSLTQPSMCSF